MKLIDILKLMYEENYNVNIKLKEFCKNGEGKIFYDGKLNDLIHYIRTHNDLNKCDGFPFQVQDISEWSVIEILVDRSRKEEGHLPDYNKGKIIVIN